MAVDHRLAQAILRFALILMAIGHQ
jgi:hypothetical protein